MKLWVKFLLITFILGIPAFILGPKIWTPSPDIQLEHHADTCPGLREKNIG